jgi:hypothetical protein
VTRTLLATIAIHNAKKGTVDVYEVVRTALIAIMAVVSRYFALWRSG